MFATKVRGERLRKNAWGRYYVTDACNGCGVCVDYAVMNFAASDDGRYFYVIQQPQDEGEEEMVRAAMRACPEECIGDDGDED
jgi:ferredoxin